jgi:hypothetical protein
LRPALAGVPLGRALDMTGGLPDLMETAWLLGVPFTAGMDRAALLSFAARLGALNYPVGAEFSYSNTGWRLAEHLLDRRGLPLGPSLDRAFFRPLGLGIRFPADEAEPVPGLTEGHWRAGADGGWRRGRYGPHFSGSGGLAGTPRDLARWLAALLADAAPLRGALAALTAPRALADGRCSFYGLGLARLRLGGEELVGHGGSLPGYKNHVLMAPARGAGVVVACNREDADPLAMALDVMAALLDTPAAPGAGDAPRACSPKADGPVWLELTGPDAVFLGAQERLVTGAAGLLRIPPGLPPMACAARARRSSGRSATRPPLPAGPARRGRPEASPGSGAAPERARRSRWRCGAARPGDARGRPAPRRRPAPPARRQPRPAGARARPWRQRACLWLRGPGALRLVTQRSRVLDFRRA